LRIADFKSLLASIVLLFATNALADEAAPPVVSKIMAHPALWVVHSRNATAFLLGSVHLLPTNVEWHTPELNAAILASDTFVFEAPLDESGNTASQEFIREHGTLPPDVSLPSLLDAQTLEDYRNALALTHVPPDSLTHLRPWLAALILEVAFIRAEHYAPESGVDRQVFALANGEGKAMRYFETVGQQFSLLTPKSPKLELAEFDAELKEFRTEANALGPLVDAWSRGNEAELGRLVNADLDSVPGTRKALLDDRNEAWVTQLKTMLAERHTYFITVGAGHLAGPHGIPALLRAQGYRVDGP
jgi:uncharacterized protein YbaP (TraB family)